MAKKKRRTGAERILAIRLGDLGDVLLAEPALRSLRLAFPGAEIDLLTRAGVQPLVEMMNLGLRVIPATGGRSLSPRLAVAQIRQLVSLRRRHYTRVVSLHHLTTARGAALQQLLVFATGAPMRVGLDNGRGWALTHRVADLGFGARHEAQYAVNIARAAGGADVPAVPMLESTSERPTSHQKHVALYPAVGAYSLARAWHAERFAELAALLTADGQRVSIVGADDAQEAARVITSRAPEAEDHTGSMSIPQLADFLREVDLVVGGDSLIGHLALAVGTPTIAIFGPSNAAAWQPVGGTVMQAGLPCQPCLYTGFRLGRPQGCPARTCMELIQPQDVFQVVRAAHTAAAFSGSSEGAASR